MCVVLCVKEWVDCEELHLRNSQEQVESLWAQIKDQTNREHLMLGVCSRDLTCRPCWISRFSCGSISLPRPHLVGVSVPLGCLLGEQHSWL